MAGSIKADTAAHTLAGIETALAITTDADRATAEAAVDQAERMCFVLDAIQRSHTVSRTTTINGEPVAASG